MKERLRTSNTTGRESFTLLMDQNSKVILWLEKSREMEFLITKTGPSTKDNSVTTKLMEKAFTLSLIKNNTRDSSKIKGFKAKES